MDNMYISACLIKQALKNSELSEYVEFRDVESDNNGYDILEIKDNDKCNEVLSFIDSELSKIQSDTDLHSRISGGIVSIGKDYVPEYESSDIQEENISGLKYEIFNHYEHYIKWCRMDNTLFCYVHPVAPIETEYGILFAESTLNEERSNKILSLFQNNNILVVDKNKIHLDITKIYKDGVYFYYASLLDSDTLNESTEILTETKISKGDIHPVFLITSFTYTALGKLISKVTNSNVSHSAISLDPNLDKMYTFTANITNLNGGFKEENIKDYIAFNKNSRIQVSVIFLKGKDFNKLKATIKDIIDNREKYSYSYKGLIDVLFKIPKADTYEMICSEFVSRVLYAIKIDISNNKALNLASPDIYELHTRNAKVYNIYDGLASDYDKNTILKMIDNTFADSEYIKESNSQNPIYLEPICVLETKEFPVDFDEDGNVIIKNYKKLNFEAEYSASHKLLKIYDDTNNYEGMKYELSKLWFMNNVLEKRIYSNPSENELRDYCKVRARILNDFNKYLKIVVNREPDFNFTKYYNDSPFSDVKIKINGTLISGLSNLLKQIF